MIEFASVWAMAGTNRQGFKIYPQYVHPRLLDISVEPPIRAENIVHTPFVLESLRFHDVCVNLQEFCNPRYYASPIKPVFRSSRNRRLERRGRIPDVFISSSHPAKVFKKLNSVHVLLRTELDENEITHFFNNIDANCEHESLWIIVTLGEFFENQPVPTFNFASRRHLKISVGCTAPYEHDEPKGKFRMVTHPRKLRGGFNLLDGEYWKEVLKESHVPDKYTVWAAKFLKQ
ncbi:hypothetical protein DL96DRAFT_1555986 [Flagelloscypha sp. PMI_526]|nr:hypothetical protein DL96DRAFT_1555986 [Flagelloscypha sp. PMI_526]